jgi:hypothetical protein
MKCGSRKRTGHFPESYLASSTHRIIYIIPWIQISSNGSGADGFEELKKYKSRMLPFMPGQRTADKERAFFSIFSTMVGGN